MALSYPTIHQWKGIKVLLFLPLSSVIFCYNPFKHWLHFVCCSKLVWLYCHFKGSLNFVFKFYQSIRLFFSYALRSTIQYKQPTYTQNEITYNTIFKRLSQFWHYKVLVIICIITACPHYLIALKVTGNKESYYVCLANFIIFLGPVLI